MSYQQHEHVSECSQTQCQINCVLTVRFTGTNPRTLHQVWYRGYNKRNKRRPQLKNTKSNERNCGQLIFKRLIEN